MLPPQAAATTFAFSSVFILLQCVGWGGAGWYAGHASNITAAALLTYSTHINLITNLLTHTFYK